MSLLMNFHPCRKAHNSSTGDISFSDALEDINRNAASAMMADSWAGKEYFNLSIRHKAPLKTTGEIKSIIDNRCIGILNLTSQVRGALRSNASYSFQNLSYNPFLNWNSKVVECDISGFSHSKVSPSPSHETGALWCQVVRF